MSRSWRWLLVCAVLLFCLSVAVAAPAAEVTAASGVVGGGERARAPVAPGAGGGTGEEESTGVARGAPITMPAFSREGRPLGGPDGVLEEMKGARREVLRALGRDGLCVSVDTEPSGVDLATCYYTGETRPAADEVFHEDDTVVFVCNSRPNPEESPEATPEP